MTTRRTTETDFGNGDVKDRDTKRLKTVSSKSTTMDPKANPYLAHMYSGSGSGRLGGGNGEGGPVPDSDTKSHAKENESGDDSEDDDQEDDVILSHGVKLPTSSNGMPSAESTKKGWEAHKLRPTTSNGSTFGDLRRHATTAAQAKAAEDGPNNPFTGKPLSQQYFRILKTRRDLPVHAQR